MLPKGIVLAWLALSACLCLASLSPLPPVNPINLGSGGLTPLSDDPSSTQFNPVAGEGGISTSVCFLNSMPELSQYELASIVSYQNNSMFVGWQNLASDDYTRQDIRFGARYTYRGLRLGLGYKVLYDNIAGYGSEKDDRLSCGIRLKVRQTTVDIWSEHAMPFQDDNRFLDGTFSLNLAQAPEPSLTLAAGLTVDRQASPELKLGCRYQLATHFQGLTSWSSNPGRFGLGLLFSLHNFKLSYGLQTHAELDWTHAIGLSLMFP